MTVRILLAAIAAGLVAGFLMTPVQTSRVVPLIMAAEAYEGGGHSHDAPAAADHTHDDGTTHIADHQPVAPAASAGHDHAAAPAEAEETLFLGRFFNTLLANMVTSVGFALLLAGISLASGVNVTFSTGIAWGFAGWLCVQLLPSLGLPPELPGFPYADLTERQIWWAATVALSVMGLWFFTLYKSQWFRALGVALFFAPHLYGAPQPADIASEVPAYLASQFAVATLATSLFMWLVMGIVLGYLWDRTAKAD